jgi:hypothetical protein
MNLTPGEDDYAAAMDAIVARCGHQPEDMLAIMGRYADPDRLWLLAFALVDIGADLLTDGAVPDLGVHVARPGFTSVVLPRISPN